MSFTAIRTATADGVATITLARPERLNAFTSAMHAELRQALDATPPRATTRCAAWC
jgi:2-(1,2-epoxy-1,2-dihydrophenyl)acetyl-CoA isomerase